MKNKMSQHLLHSSLLLCYNTPLMDTSKLTIAKPAIGKIGPIQFIRQSIEELKKVSWPTRAETIKLTLIVFAVSAAVGAYIGGLDFLYTKLVELILK